MKERISITLETELRKFAEDAAKKDGRSVSNYIEQLIRKDKEQHNQ